MKTNRGVLSDILLSVSLSNILTYASLGLNHITSRISDPEIQEANDTLSDLLLDAAKKAKEAGL